MSDHDHETRLKLAELRIQRAKLIGVFATSVAAVATAAVVIVPMVSDQSAAARQAAPTQEPAPSAALSAAPVPVPGTEHSPPSPREVCQHVVDLMKDELGEQADAMPAEEVEKVLNNCIRAAEEERRFKGSAVYDEQAACVLQASNLQGLERCEASDSEMTLGAPSNQDVCLHVMDIMKREFGEAEGAKAPSDAELEKFTTKCIKDLAKEREKLGARAYTVQVSCVMAASRMEDLMKCDRPSE